MDGSVRRTLLVLALVATLALAGCSADEPTAAALELPGGEGVGVAATNHTLAPGESATVTVRAAEVGELTVRPADDYRDALRFDWRNVSVDPAPSGAVDTLPPYYTWDVVRGDVTAAVRVRAAEDAPAGSYAFDAVAINNTDHDHDSNATARFVVRVTEGDEAGTGADG